jgi:hypothetical protein
LEVQQSFGKSLNIDSVLAGCSDKPVVRIPLKKIKWKNQGMLLEVLGVILPSLVLEPTVIADKGF